jgi:hypothetical protein
VSPVITTDKPRALLDSAQQSMLSNAVFCIDQSGYKQKPICLGQFNMDWVSGQLDVNHLDIMTIGPEM